MLFFCSGIFANGKEDEMLAVTQQIQPNNFQQKQQQQSRKQPRPAKAAASSNDSENDNDDSELEEMPSKEQKKQ